MTKTGIMHHLSVEVMELTAAQQEGRVAHVLDELVDVQYYLDRLAAAWGITDHTRRAYAVAKGHLRETIGKDKAIELQVAESFIIINNQGERNEQQLCS